MVEDHLDTLNLYTNVLRAFGSFQCMATDDPAEAQRWAAETRFVAIVMDLGLPRLEDGLALARALRALPDPAPIVAVSGYTLDNANASLFVAGLFKPFEIDELVAVVMRFRRA